MATPEIDITTEEGMQQASAGKSSLSVYLQQMGKLQREAFEKVYNAVDQPCMPSCETDMDQFMMVCTVCVVTFRPCGLLHPVYSVCVLTSSSPRIFMKAVSTTSVLFATL
jgi:hypothetical protein